MQEVERILTKVKYNGNSVDTQLRSSKPVMILYLLFFSEHIFGYKDLRINIYCLAARMTTYVKIDYTDKITPETCDGLSVSILFTATFKLFLVS